MEILVTFPIPHECLEVFTAMRRVKYERWPVGFAIRLPDTLWQPVLVSDRCHPANRTRLILAPSTELHSVNI